MDRSDRIEADSRLSSRGPLIGISTPTQLS